MACSRYPHCRWTGVYDIALSLLAAQLDELRAQLALNRPGTAGVDVVRELRAIIAFAHPDRWPNAGELATGITQRLNALRERLA